MDFVLLGIFDQLHYFLLDTLFAIHFGYPAQEALLALVENNFPADVILELRVFIFQRFCKCQCLVTLLGLLVAQLPAALGQLVVYFSFEI